MLVALVAGSVVCDGACWWWCCWRVDMMVCGYYVAHASMRGNGDRGHKPSAQASVAAYSCWAVDEACGVPFPTSASTEPPQTETDQGSWETLGWRVPVE